MPKTIFDDEFFQDVLVTLLCRDREALKVVGHLLTAKDFSPVAGHRHGHQRWLVSQLALEYWNRYRQPIRRLLSSEVIAHCLAARISDRHREDILAYANHLLQAKVRGAAAVIDKVLTFRRERATAQALEQMIELQAAGQLTDQEWLRITQETLAVGKTAPQKPLDYVAGLQDRIERRSRPYHRTPMLFIAPLDELVLGPGFGQLAMGLGPYGRGKSLFLIWVALAYTLQKMDVLFFTLEDPREQVEDRFDAAVTSLPLFRLRELPETVRTRFKRWSRLTGHRLKIYDGTDEGVTVQRLEQVFLEEREQGFQADAILVDYDDEIVPAIKRKERRMELADIYRDMRRLAAKHNLIVWTVAQTQRGTEGMKILSGDRVAEDISKLRKVSVAISLGQGEWGPDSVYLYVAKHKFDKQHIGCNIMSNKDRMLIYDIERTQRRKRIESHSPEATG